MTKRYLNRELKMPTTCELLLAARDVIDRTDCISRDRKCGKTHLTAHQNIHSTALKLMSELDPTSDSVTRTSRRSQPSDAEESVKTGEEYYAADPQVHVYKA